METTITIDEDILQQLKERAAKENTTVSRLIEESVRVVALTPAGRANQPFKLVTFGHGGSDVNVDRISELIELDDIARYGYRR